MPFPAGQVCPSFFCTLPLLAYAYAFSHPAEEIMIDLAVRQAMKDAKLAKL